MSEIITTNENQITTTAAGRLDQNPAAVYLSRLAGSGRRTQKQALDKMAGMMSNGRADSLSFPWQELRYQHTAALRARLTEDLSAATVNKHLSALRAVLRESWRLGLMSAEDYQRAADLEAVTGSTIPAGRELSSGEISGLLSACAADESAAGARDAAVIALLYGCGLRRDEITKLAFENLDMTTGRLVIVGKRNKQRTAYLTNGVFDTVADWLTLRGSESGPLFYPVNKAGKITHRQMSNQAIYKLLAKRAAEAGVKDFSPHDLRRTFVSDLLDAGADITTVAKMAGHANVTTTARYDRRGEVAKQKAGGLLHVPYYRRTKGED